MTSAPIAFIWGDDSYAIETAVEAFRGQDDVFPGGAPERWRVDVESGAPGRTFAQLQERLQTGVMFGAGTLAVVSGVGPLVRRADDRERLTATLALIAPGNGLVFAEETESGRREPPHRPLVEAVRAAGGREIPVRLPKPGELANWIRERARERGINLAPDAVRELVTRVGGMVTEADADRRQQGRLAVMELEKLSLYRLDGAPVTAADVKALVAETVPASTWALVDAVGMRNAGRALVLADGVFERQPEPVVITALHRRLRELIEIADRLDRGERARDLPRSMKLNPYRAERLAAQAITWTVDELEAALAGLLELDAMLKGVPGLPSGDAQRRLAFVRWMNDRVERAA
jgi:DNA polymerase-3 subunit delta